MRSKGDSGLEARTVEQDDGFGRRVEGVAEVVDVAVGAQAADDGGAGRGVHPLALGSDGNLAVVPDAHGGLLAPDKGPPRAGWHRAQDGAFFRQRLWACGVRGGPQFAVDFVFVGVGQALIEQAVAPSSSPMWSAASRGGRRFCQ